MTIADAATILRDVVVSGAAIVTAFVAVKGINSWQKELAGRAGFDAARGLMSAVYRLRNELRYCRSPLITGSEFPEDYDSVKATPEQRGDGLAHVYTQRWKPVADALNTFDTAVIEAEALWGNDIREKALELRQCVRKLQVDIDCLIRNEYSGGEDFQDREYAVAVRSGVSEIKPEENKLSIRIKEAVEGIEEVVKPHLARGS